MTPAHTTITTILQHAAGIRALEALTGARVVGNRVGSLEVRLFPGAAFPGGGRTIVADAFTAGSVSLMLQTVLPPALLLAPPSASSASVPLFLLRGGTWVAFSPPVAHAVHALLPLLSCMAPGLRDRAVGGPGACAGLPAGSSPEPPARLELTKEGYNSKGGGEVALFVQPVPFLKPLLLDTQGTIDRIVVQAFVAGRHNALENASAAAELGSAATALLRAHFGERVVFVEHFEDGYARRGAVPGGDKAHGVFLCALTSTGGVLASSALGAGVAGGLQRQWQQEAVVREAVAALLGTCRSGAAVDEHTADQLICFMALAQGESLLRVPRKRSSQHLETVIVIAESILGAKFSARDSHDGMTSLISCVGAGTRNPHFL
jgi:RNA 3'-terminal phosphate cyclase (ATP)